ncbi:hypothetical protein [Pseudomonas sp. NBRC 111124]|uniref:hypothetical protein n=1 Tax=Pseudomonas sp. NBRC 111124 TaxID=1661039 RepID=UPI0007620C41|nr:hypothetical protein [Pseudomonas sp. NBRC 111124]
MLQEQHAWELSYTELVRGVIEAIDEHCRAHAGEPGLNMLGNAMHASEILPTQRKTKNISNLNFL